MTFCRFASVVLVSSSICSLPTWASTTMPGIGHSATASNGWLCQVPDPCCHQHGSGAIFASTFLNGHGPLDEEGRKRKRGVGRHGEPLSGGAEIDSDVAVLLLHGNVQRAIIVRVEHAQRELASRPYVAQ